MKSRQNYLEELQQLRNYILEMSTQVEEDLSRALIALRNGDKILAEQVKKSGARVDTMQYLIEDEAAIIIATQQPVARDLREMVTIFKLTVNLERIGDHAVHLAKAVSKLSSEPAFRSVHHIEKMAEIGLEMLRATITSYFNYDADGARKAAAMDDGIDAEHKALIDEVLLLMKGNPKLVKKAHRLLVTSNNIERLGDHITNICEAIIYMVLGTHEELND